MLVHEASQLRVPPSIQNQLVLWDEQGMQLCYTWLTWAYQLGLPAVQKREPETARTNRAGQASSNMQGLVSTSPWRCT